LVLEWLKTAEIQTSKFWQKPSLFLKLLLGQVIRHANAPLPEVLAVLKGCSLSRYVVKLQDDAPRSGAVDPVGSAPSLLMNAVSWLTPWETSPTAKKSCNFFVPHVFRDTIPHGVG
jgi:hypothetical protein